jgi:hypothetical protein
VLTVSKPDAIEFHFGIAGKLPKNCRSPDLQNRKEQKFPLAKENDYPSGKDFPVD